MTFTYHYYGKNITVDEIKQKVQDFESQFNKTSLKKSSMQCDQLIHVDLSQLRTLWQQCFRCDFIPEAILLNLAEFNSSEFQYSPITIKVFRSILMNGKEFVNIDEMSWLIGELFVNDASFRLDHINGFSQVFILAIVDAIVKAQLDSDNFPIMTYWSSQKIRSCVFSLCNNVEIQKQSGLFSCICHSNRFKWWSYEDEWNMITAILGNYIKDTLMFPESWPNLNEFIQSIGHENLSWVFDYQKCMQEQSILWNGHIDNIFELNFDILRNINKAIQDINYSYIPVIITNEYRTYMAHQCCRNAVLEASKCNYLLKLLSALVQEF